CRCPLPHPEPVASFERVFDKPLLLIGAACPMMGFGMPVRKSKPTTEVVINPREVKPSSAYHREGEGGVVEGLGVFVHQHPKVSRPRCPDAGELTVSEPRR